MNTAPLRVTAPRLDQDGEHITLGALVDEHRLFWTMPTRASIALRGEPFVCALLVSAMSTGRDLELPVELPLDPLFHAGLAEMQVIFARWFPGLRAVAVRASLAPRTGTSGRFTGYSGGIDSSYTVSRLADSLDGVVLFDGIEYEVPNPELMARVDQLLRATMTARGLPMLRVQTNAKWVGKATGGRWFNMIGGCLASVPHALGVASYAIASSYAWEKLPPYGSHPITDPRWSSGATRIAHHGCDLDRLEKTVVLAAAPDLLAALRVCFQGDAYNCGRCQKCLQNAAALRSLGVTTPAMPPLIEAKALRVIHIGNEYEEREWLDIRNAALRRHDTSLWRELNRLTSRYARRQAARQLDQLATGGLLRRWLLRK